MRRTPSDSQELSRIEPDDVGARAQFAGPSIRLRRLRKKRKGGDRHVQTALRDEGSNHRAPLGQRKLRQSNMPPVGCQTSDKMELRVTPPMLRFLSIRHLAVIDQLELEFGPGLTVLTGETGAGKSILVGAVGLLVGGRASADLVRTGEDIGRDRSDLRHRRTAARVIVRREISAQGRSRAFVDGALATSARAARALAARSSTCTASTSIRCCSIPRRTSMCSTRTPGSKHERAARRRGVRRVAGAARPSASALRRQPARERRARRVPRVPAGRDRSRRARSRGRRRARGDATGAGERRQAAAALRRGVPVAVRGRPGGPRRARRRVAARSGSSRRSTNGSRRTSPRATPSSRRSRTSRTSSARTPRHRRQPGAAAGGRGPARGARASEEEARADARDVIAKGDELQARARRSRARDRARRRARRARSRPRARRTSSAAERAVARRRQRPRRSSAGRSRRSLGDLAMARTRCEVRFTTPSREAEWTERGIEQAEFYISPNPGEDLQAAGAHRVGRRALAHHARAEDARLDRRAGEDARSSTRSTPASAGQWRTSSACGSRTLAKRFRCSASRTCRRSPPTAARTSRSRSRCSRAGR